MKLGLNLQASLQQTLTPQQIQYLKLLQLSALQFEQHVRGEIENNPMLEEQREDGSSDATSMDIAPAEPAYTEAAYGDTSYGDTPYGDTSYAETSRIDAQQGGESGQGGDGDANSPASISSREQSVTTESYDTPVVDPDAGDGFDFYKLIWGEDPSAARSSDFVPDDSEEDELGPQFRETESLEDDLIEQIKFLPFSDEERLFAEYVVGNVDADGYLRRDIEELVLEINTTFSEHDLAIQAPKLLGTKSTAYDRGLIEGIDRVLAPMTIKQADAVIKRVQALDPPGFASRTVQECLIAQLRAVQKPNAGQKLALLVLTDAYDAFTMKHFGVIERQLEISEDYLREAIDVIRHLNPRPGSGTLSPEVNTFIPDFLVERTEDGVDFLITVNDSRLPTLRVSNAYERLKKEARFHKFNKETREWLRKKYEDAKFLMQAIRQRKSTMLRVMTAIAGLQEDFFRMGPAGLKPLIYRDVAEITGLDISTICRIVNGKYVLTEFGTFELKYFFSESLVTDEGEEVSTRIIKQKIKELIEAESKTKPFSDDKLAKDLKRYGYNVARRTVAKYREQLRIPVARLRREL